MYIYIYIYISKETMKEHITLKSTKERKINYQFDSRKNNCSK
jgi:hypothetical protein